MNFLINLVFGLFVLSTICYWISLTMRINSNIFPFLTTGTTIAANMLLFVFLGYRWIKEGYFPLSNLYESLLFLTWCLTSVQLISEAKTSSKIIGSINRFFDIYFTSRNAKSCTFSASSAIKLVNVTC